MPHSLAQKRFCGMIWFLSNRFLKSKKSTFFFLFYKLKVLWLTLLLGGSMVDFNFYEPDFEKGPLSTFLSLYLRRYWGEKVLEMYFLVIFPVVELKHGGSVTNIPLTVSRPNKLNWSSFVEFGGNLSPLTSLASVLLWSMVGFLSSLSCSPRLDWN